MNTNDLSTERKATGAPRSAPVAFSGDRETVFAGQFDDLRTIEKFLVFFLDQCCYGVSARSVAEVSRPLPVAFLPHSPPWLSGVANLRGEIIPVLNSAAIFGANAAERFSDAGKFIILRARAFDSPIALPVERLSEIAAFGEEEFQPAEQTHNDFVFASIAHQTTVLHLIDAEKMLASATD